MKRLLVITLLLVVPLGCGGGGSDSGPNKGSGEQAVTPAAVAGNWQFEAHSSVIPGTYSIAGGSILQNGSTLNGKMIIAGSPCATEAPFNGTLSGTVFNGTLSESGQAITLKGTTVADGTSMSGSYSSPAGGCTNGDVGTFSGQRYKSVSGTYTGTLESYDTWSTPPFQVTLNITQDGQGQLTGSSVFNVPPCFSSWPLSGLIAGSAFVLIDRNSGGSALTISGTTDISAEQLNIDYQCAGDSGGGTLTHQTGPIPSVGISVSPASATVLIGRTQQFFAAVTGTTNNNVTWQVNGIVGGNFTFGSITSGGLYTAPANVPNPQTVTISAVSQADPTKSATAVVTITAVTISISPISATVDTGDTQQFTATVSGASNIGVVWQVNGINGGNNSIGVISTTGLYTAPMTLPSYPRVSIIAVAEADTTSTATATVTIVSSPAAANQAPQSWPILLGTSGGDSLDTTVVGNTTTCCSGTLGALVERAGIYYILSANHVLARSNQAFTGEPITQPGLVDNNCDPATPVANLSSYVPLPMGGTSTTPKTGTVDAAMAQIIPGAVDTSGGILELGTASSNPNTPNPAPPASTIALPTIGMGVAKSGRASGLTCSTISSVNTIVDIDYSTSCSGGSSFTVEFDNQIVIAGSSFSGGGDSGSLLVNSATAQPVGLVYGGDSTSTVASPIGDVLSALTDSQGNAPTIVGGDEHPIACPASMTPSAKHLVLSPLQIGTAVDAKNKHKVELMSNPAVFGVGVGASEYNVNEATIVLYVDRDSNYTPPSVIDGIPVRVQRTDRFRAWNWGRSEKSRSCKLPTGSQKTLK